MANRRSGTVRAVSLLLVTGAMLGNGKKNRLRGQVGWMCACVVVVVACEFGRGAVCVCGGGGW